jgi:hypothetical protein
MLGIARGGGAVSRTLRGLYGGRASRHISITYGTRPVACLARTKMRRG